MSDEFIPKSISSKVVVIKNDNPKCKSYETNLAEKNDKNNSYHIIRSVVINKAGILSGYIYTDVNESKQNIYLKLISTIIIFLIIMP